MKASVELTEKPIAEMALLRSRALPRDAGAVVCFVGSVRDSEPDGPISGLEYEAFAPMAEHQFRRLLETISGKWPIVSVRVVHRVGRVGPGEPSVWVEVIAPHRQEAFEACQWLIEEMKRGVPIWKKPLR
jgi:molybdopterin synthase catalytic subunit